jgi:ribosomal protein S18 acetylase RimI-like enzyme
MAPTVREAQPDDVPALAAMLARAFDDDPITRWFYRRDASRQKWSGRYFAWQLRRLLPQGQIHQTQDASGAALWALPDRWRESPGDSARLFAATGAALLPRLPTVLAGVGRIERRHPEQRHLYLSVLGTDPARQGEGVGTALLAPGLALCDAEGLPAYLESSKEKNLAFYARFGFRVTGEVRLPRDGPVVWLMWRDPR